mmetsp:Transcript_42382/g.70240  ORF Transcript_42382/g.70240 Transcript_42382/m.70240 type:complete len:87 (+) Transcript_42382:1098-1358(+)
MLQVSPFAVSFVSQVDNFLGFGERLFKCRDVKLGDPTPRQSSLSGTPLKRDRGLLGTALSADLILSGASGLSCDDQHCPEGVAKFR